MKVICIKDSWKIFPGNDIAINPKFGKIYTVADCGMINGKPGYLFEEIPHIQQCRITGKYAQHWWTCENFIPYETYKEKEIKELKQELAL